MIDRSIRWLRPGPLTWVLFAIALIFAPFAGFSWQGLSNAHAQTTDDGSKADIKTQIHGAGTSWTIELADNGESRSRGLMFRKSMPAGTGMLFRFEESGLVQMWMKNTFIPLDMVFIGTSGVIKHVHKGAVPQSLDIISSRVPIRFVLEINAGEADAAGLKPGILMRHPWFEKPRELD